MIKNLFYLIDRFIAGDMSYGEFYSSFNDLYISDCTHLLPEDQLEFIESINERLFFVGENPSDEEQKRHGYINSLQFKDWLERMKKENITFWPAGD